MRLIQLLAVSDSPEGFRTIMERLQKDYGEPIISKRSGIIPMEKGAFEKLKRLQNVR